MTTVRTTFHRRYGLDGMIGGGLPHGCYQRVVSSSGSGKSVLAAGLQMDGARGGETGAIEGFSKQPRAFPIDDDGLKLRRMLFEDKGTAGQTVDPMRRTRWQR